MSGEEQSSKSSSEGLIGIPDGYQRLWTPHRMVYVKDATQPSKNECPFCKAVTFNDEESLIIWRGTYTYVILNLYPYNNGHMLVCTYRHVSSYDELTVAETSELAQLTQQAMRVARQTLKCHGFNLGMNQGEIAGAGVAAHLHQHIVPRWDHDSNFFPIIAQTKALPQLLADVREQLSNAWHQAV